MYDFFIYFIFIFFNILFIVLIGGVFPLIERKFLSLMQRRIGPNFVGYRGRLQFIADALKLFLKEYIILNNVNKFLFFLYPSFFVFCSLIFFINLYLPYNIFYIDIEYNFIFLIILSGVLHFFSIFSGFICFNKYTILSTNRAFYLFFIFEILFTSFILNFFFILKNFSFSSFFLYTNEKIFFFIFFFMLPSIFYIILLDLSRAPFDLVEAETELIMGYIVEYSSFLFGLYVLGEYLHIFFFSYISILFIFL